MSIKVGTHSSSHISMLVPLALLLALSSPVLAALTPCVILQGGQRASCNGTIYSLNTVAGQNSRCVACFIAFI